MAVIGVVGLGAMGLGIVQVYAQAGFTVYATDTQEGARNNALKRLNDALQPRVDSGKMTAEAMQAIVSAITVTTRPEDFVAPDMVIEAIIEDLAIKQALFARIERAFPEAILATNTSALSVMLLSRGLHKPENLVGLHFFNPAPVMKLVELVVHLKASEATLSLAEKLTSDAGKTVIRCADTPGFIVNRCARPFYGEALAMVAEGRWPSEIDASMLAAGYRMGPFALIDLIGADINLAATEGMSRAMGGNPRYHVFNLLREQVAKGDLGRKSGRGFLFPGVPEAPPSDAEWIATRIEATLANEAASLVESGGATPEAIDSALKLGLNFPRGPFESARARGIPLILKALAQLEVRAPAELKGRYVASPVLTAMA